MKKYIVSLGPDGPINGQYYQVATEDYKYGDCKAVFWGKDCEQAAKNYAKYMNAREQAEEWRKREIVHWKIEDVGVACKSDKRHAKFNVQIEDVTCGECKQVYQSRIHLIEFSVFKDEPENKIQFREFL